MQIARAQRAFASHPQRYRQELYDTGFDLEKFAEKVKDRRKDLVGSGHLVWCNRFMAAGATYCGGCCGTVPDQIRELAESLKSSEKVAICRIARLLGLATLRNLAPRGTLARWQDMSLGGRAISNPRSSSVAVSSRIW